MIIKILELFSVNGITHVSFFTSSGNGIAAWIGHLPHINQEYDVELDLDDIFSWGENIKPSAQNISRIYPKNGKTHLIAELISVDDDNCAVIKLNETITLIELNAPPDQKPKFVELEITKIALYPTNI